MSPNRRTEASLSPPAQAASSRSGGKPPVTAQTRLRGGAAVVLGVLIAGTLAVALASEAPQMLNPGSGAEGSRFTGTLEQGRLAVFLMAWAMLTGILFIAAGFQLLREGRLRGWLKGVTAVVLVVLGALLWRFGSVFG